MKMLQRIWQPKHIQPSPKPVFENSNLIEIRQALEVDGSQEAEEAIQRIRQYFHALTGSDDERFSAINHLTASKAFIRVLSQMAYSMSSIDTQYRARALLTQVAAAQGLSRLELEDWLVPTCDLDKTNQFDYGPRQFSLALGMHHRPLIREPSGRLRTSLPRPKPTDQPEFVAKAHNRWHDRKFKLSRQSRIQTARLEQIMIEGRRWNATGFANILAHPLLRVLAGHVLWATYRPDGALETVFVLNDNTLIGTNYREYKPDDHAVIGLPHTLELTPAQRVAGAELLHDFQIAPLFAQTDRPVSMLTAEEQTTATTGRFAGTLWSNVFETHTWQLDNQEQTATKRFDDAGILATLFFKSTPYSAKKITHCSFTAIGDPHAPRPVTMRQIAPGTLDPIVISEVLVQLSDSVNIHR